MHMLLCVGMSLMSKDPNLQISEHISYTVHLDHACEKACYLWISWALLDWGSLHGFLMEPASIVRH